MENHIAAVAGSVAQEFAVVDGDSEHAVPSDWARLLLVSTATQINAPFNECLDCVNLRLAHSRHFFDFNNPALGHGVLGVRVVDVFG